MRINSATDLEVYKKAYHLAMLIYKISKFFPKEELYSLTSQYKELKGLCSEIGKMLGSMINNPKPFLIK